MATFPGVVKTLFAITTSFLWPATSAPSGSGLRARRARSRCDWRNTATVVIAGDGGMGAGVSFTVALAKISSTIFGVGRTQSSRSAIAWAVQRRERREEEIVVGTDREIVGSNEIRRLDGPRRDRHGDELPQKWRHVARHDLGEDPFASRSSSGKAAIDRANAVPFGADGCRGGKSSDLRGERPHKE